MVPQIIDAPAIVLRIFGNGAAAKRCQTGFDGGHANRAGIQSSAPVAADTVSPRNPRASMSKNTIRPKRTLARLLMLPHKVARALKIAIVAVVGERPL
jgi:hypothetical protein